MSSDIHELMQIIDNNRENIQENDYLQMCNLMKNLYNIHNNNNKPLYFQIIYNDKISDIVIAQKKKLPFHNVIIRVYKDINETLNIIAYCVEDIVFNKLSYKTYSKIIECYGTREQAYEKMKDIIGHNYDNYIHHIEKRSKIVLERTLAYHIMDRHFIKFLPIQADNIEYAINADDFERVCLNLM